MSFKEKLLYLYKGKHSILGRVLSLPQVKRSVIISNKHGIYELLHELSNNLRLIFLGNLKIKTS